MNGFTECLDLKLAAFGIRARLVLPDRSPTTRFGDNARGRMAGTIPEAYAPLAQSIFAGWGEPGLVTEAVDVAEAVWLAGR